MLQSNLKIQSHRRKNNSVQKELIILQQHHIHTMELQAIKLLQQLEEIVSQQVPHHTHVRMVEQT